MTEHHEGHVHTHSGEVEIQIPSWVVYTAVVVGAGLVTWFALDVWQQSRKREIALAVVEVIPQPVSKEPSRENPSPVL